MSSSSCSVAGYLARYLSDMREISPRHNRFVFLSFFGNPRNSTHNLLLIPFLALSFAHFSSSKYTTPFCYHRVYYIEPSSAPSVDIFCTMVLYMRHRIRRCHSPASNRCDEDETKGFPRPNSILIVRVFLVARAKTCTE